MLTERETALARELEAARKADATARPATARRLAGSGTEVSHA
jgi:hypothetical protein